MTEKNDKEKNIIKTKPKNNNVPVQAPVETQVYEGEQFSNIPQSVNQGGKFKGDPNMQKAYQVASKINLEMIERESPEDLKHLKSVKESDIIILTGQYDHGQVIFELSGIPYSLISPNEISSIELRSDQILFVNCPGNIEKRGLERIKSFVETGGMLVTTDWALKNVLEQIYPDIVKYNNQATSDDVVRVVFEKVDDTFLKGLLDPKDEPLWWLEGSSYPIEILDEEKVTVLVSSKEMKEKYGESPIVITFEVGEGKIYHMTSHFYLQRTESRSQRQKMGGASYAAQKGMKMDSFTPQEVSAMEDVNVAQTEAAYTSIRSVSNMVMEQKKRVAKRSKK
ncbi:MAG: hypothetical protein HeimC3_53880 [Candidatus Heimdallarchaeota archaeon LC_3]|nr:MAG: hypothetical protein HeimC3_53880 [Candidatus Heimdallarchaeota archaeon LC_3]